MWYFHGAIMSGEATLRARFCGLLRGLICHQGTIILGAFSAGLVHPVRGIVRMLTGFARLDNNPIGQVVGAVCCCLVGCYEGLLEPLSRNACMEVAMGGKSFCDAAWFVQDVMFEDDTVHLLSGATWTFQVVGIGSIGLTGFIVTQLFTIYGGFKESGDAFVFNLFVESLIGGCVAAFVAFPFMMLFDLVSDTVLYCHLIDQLLQLQEEEEDKGIDEGWVSSMGNYVRELVNCTCSLRVKEVPSRDTRAASDSNMYSAKLAAGGSNGSVAAKTRSQASRGSGGDQRERSGIAGERQHTRDRTGDR